MLPDVCTIQPEAVISKASEQHVLVMAPVGRIQMTLKPLIKINNSSEKLFEIKDNDNVVDLAYNVLWLKLLKAALCAV